MSIYEHVMDTLRTTSRTFFIPIRRLPAGLQEAVASAYLCMRAIDEIEDHAQLERRVKIRQLRSVSQLLQAQSDVDTFARDDFSAAFADQQDLLPAVTLGLADWACYAPNSIASDSVAYFIKIPLALAYATLDALARGEAKLSRGAVLQLLEHINES